MEEPLYAPSTVRRLLGEHGLRPDKAFGQNYLIDGNTLERIVKAAEIALEDSVLEIGPGLGVLTRELAKRAGMVIAVELDRRLLPVLSATLAAYANVRVVHEDGLRFDLALLPKGSLLIANLPYNVGTAVMVRALESGRFKRLVCLLQKEVAQRLVAAPGSEAYGYLSLIAAHYGQAVIVKDVPKTAFFPPPEVTSSIVKLELDPKAAPDPELFGLIEASFKHRRKTLKRNLLMAGYPEALVVAALEGLGLEVRVRAETLSISVFNELKAALNGLHDRHAPDKDSRAHEV